MYNWKWIMIEIRKSHTAELKIFSALDKQKDVKNYVERMPLDEHSPATMGDISQFSM